MEKTLQGQVEELFGHPTLEGVDDLLGELRDRRSEPAVAGLIDDLLDHRFALSRAGAAA